ncbi:regulatory protein ArsR [Pseudonocardia dioxanivorans CB1190]|uniref:Regulatory protein ArsR n=1 Tax=Pseudonocardia dioxanivorans (strain ATCC 55486 / DSM 44775 / JCM 13855 / CB1190) TaxID=675635 RepID=F4CK97_PSEUX|nr:metalloregulator ArsR/SmtB family transcription factor [Pseudonocardia dioxanivorans]AEA22320.1 regulatory protein ArsR [Pseudonocardia dioxanivorans CB1190]
MHESIAGFEMPAEDEVRRAADVLRMLSDPTRMKILWALLQGESSVACLAELVGATPTAVSQHLSKLRLAGYVQNRREATFVYYTVENPAVRPLLEQIFATTPAARDAVTARP